MHTHCPFSQMEILDVRQTPRQVLQPGRARGGADRRLRRADVAEFGAHVGHVPGGGVGGDD